MGSTIDGPHADLVFHVLAHVRPTRPLNASVFDPNYIAFCVQFLGDAEDRALGEDARVLARLLEDHDSLARVQLLAWLFREDHEGENWDEVELFRFPSSGPYYGDVLDALRRADGHAVELLRCAIALERTHFHRLPLPDRSSESAVREEVGKLSRIAPRLSSAAVGLCRALGRRGRACGDSILVGLPEGEPFSPSIEHASFQAAHEAVVREVSCAEALPFLETERAALTVLKERARGTPFEEGHGRWLASLDLNQFGGAKALTLEHLGTATRLLVDSLLAR